MIDWKHNVRQYHLLGLWHAVQYLKTVSTVKDPTETAKDVVQNAWLSLWRQDKFTKGLFVTAVLGFAYNAARDSRPVELAFKPKNANGVGKDGRVRERTTDSFPVQIFGTMLDGTLHEVTERDFVRHPGCGDE